MKKGNFGFKLCLYSVLAFILAYFGNSTVLFLLAGAVFFLEKDEWTGRQIIQAVCLYFTRSLINTVLNFVGSITRMPLINKIPMIASAWSVTDTLIDSIVGIFILVCCILGIINNLKGKDANIVGASKLADWAYGSTNSSNV